MNIVFLCGSMEPGSDGVGDYTRRLACACIRAGNSCSVIALNDKYIDGNTEEAFCTETQCSDDIAVSTFRFSNAQSWESKASDLMGLLATLKPDWVSLQFVPYSFHPKGLPFGLVKLLNKVQVDYQRTSVTKPRFHIMFHELWLGVIGKKRIKDQCIAAIQRLLIKRLIGCLEPSLVHTQTRLYQKSLQETYDLEVGYLPLFGNIPYALDGGIDEDLAKHFRDSLSVLHFGTTEAENPSLDSFLRELDRRAKAQRFRPLYVHVGRGGAHLAKTLKTVASVLGEQNTLSLGELPSQQVSKVMQLADYGYCRYNGYYWEKSGVVAAMIEHDLPVLISSAEPHNLGDEDTRHDWLYSNIPDQIPNRSDGKSKDLVLEIAQKFIDDLAES